MLNDAMLDFVRKNRTGAMITVRKDGSSHVARCTVGVVDGKLVSSGTQTRVRTKHVRQNPKATLFIFGQGGDWLGVEANVTLHEGEEGLQKDLALKTTLDGVPDDAETYLKTRREQQRLIYEFEPVRVYGSYE